MPSRSITSAKWTPLAPIRENAIDFVSKKRALKAATRADVGLRRAGPHRDPDARLGDVGRAADNDDAFAHQTVDRLAGHDGHVGGARLVRSG